jgi:4-coumarate--CoA ligase
MNTIMTIGLQLGAKTVTVPKFEPEMYLNALSTYKPTYLNLVPPLVSFLSTNPLVKTATHLSSIKTVSGGAAPFGPALIEKFMEKCAPNKVNFTEGFGMTESSPVSHIQPRFGAKLGGCGHPIPNMMAKVSVYRLISTFSCLRCGKKGIGLQWDSTPTFGSVSLGQ